MTTNCPLRPLKLLGRTKLSRKKTRFAIRRRIPDQTIAESPAWRINQQESDFSSDSLALYLQASQYYYHLGVHQVYDNYNNIFPSNSERLRQQNAVAGYIGEVLELLGQEPVAPEIDVESIRDSIQSFNFDHPSRNYRCR